MALIISEDREVKATLEKLVAMIRGNGGFVHPGMMIRCNEGELSIHASSPEMQGDWLFSVPNRCLIPIHDFKWGLNGTDIVIEPAAESVHPVQAAMAGLVADLFNRTGKIQRYNDSCMLLRGRNNRELIEMLFSARNNDLPLEEMKNDILNFNGNAELNVKSYFYTRTYGGAKAELVLMPVLDVLNNHFDGAWIDEYSEDAQTEVKDGRFRHGLRVRCKCPVAGSDECFTNYSVHRDVHDLYLLYQYIDESVPVLRSVPVEADLGEYGLLKINSTLLAPGFNRSSLPDHIADLWFFLAPAKMDMQPRKTMTLGYLYIPGQDSPLAMRRVLSLAVRELDHSLPQGRVQDLVLAAEKTILGRNLEYYNRLRDYIRNSSPAPEDAGFFNRVGKLAQTQLAKLAEYGSFHGYE